ncbi:MAG: hypothetical protein O2898_03705 [Proteobacteria bacterium]|nr:hypothetical protein [Pseudomonadota bacterium]
MTQEASMFELTKTRLAEGIWEGILTRSEGVGDPRLTVRHMDRTVPGLEVAPDDAKGRWRVRLPIPREAIADGVQTLVISDGDTVLADITLIAGEALADDIRAEVELLRAELDMLKRAFRRHCLETM